MRSAQDSVPSRASANIRSERPYPKVALLIFDQPDRRNCLSYAFLLELKDLLQKLSEDPKISAIVLAAEGPTFCAGHDLEEMRKHYSDKDHGRAFYSQTMMLCSDVMQSINACPQPVIAAVQAIATAAGCQLVASCDLAVAEENAEFATPGVNIGLFCSTPMVALSRTINRKHALEMLLLGERINARKAEEIGLINRIVPQGQAREVALQIAVMIASKPSKIIKLGKAAFYRQIEEPMHSAYHFASQVMVENLLKADAKEGINAFLEKRHPKWTES